MSRKVAIAALLTAGVALSQTFEVANPLGSHRGGIHLYSASVYSGYASLDLPDNSTFQPVNFRLGGDALWGGSVSIGWATQPRERSSFSLRYTGGYSGRVRHQEWNAMNQSLALSASRQLGRKWTMDFALTGGVNDLNQFLFTPTLLGGMTQAPISFDDLAKAVMNGSYTNEQFAATLTGGPVMDSLARTLVYGTRVFSASTSAGLTYAPSQRLSFHIHTGASRSQSLQDDTVANTPASSPYLNQGTTGNAGVGMSYSITPRTTFALDASASRMFSSYQDSYNSNFSATLSRRMGRRWFLTGHGGAGFITALRQTYQLPRGPQYLAGGSLGYTHHSHRFMASVNRTISDSYGIGAGNTFSAMGSWTWHRPGRSWSTTVSGGRQQMQGSPDLNLDAWVGSAGFARALSRTIGLQVAYTYMNNTGRGLAFFGGLRQEFVVHAVRLTLGWTPNRTDAGGI